MNWIYNLLYWLH